MNTLNRLPVYLFIYLFIFTLVPPSGCSMNRHQTQLELIYEQMMSNLISFKKKKNKTTSTIHFIKIYIFVIHCICPLFSKAYTFPSDLYLFLALPWTLLPIVTVLPSLVSLIDLIVFSSVNSFASTHLYNAKKTFILNDFILFFTY